jgi:hypothetical protein
MTSLYLTLSRNVHDDPNMKFTGCISTNATAGGAVIIGQMRMAKVTDYPHSVNVTAYGTYYPKKLEVIIYDDGCMHRATITKDVGPDAIKLKFARIPMRHIDCQVKPNHSLEEPAGAETSVQ